MRLKSRFWSVRLFFFTDYGISRTIDNPSQQRGHVRKGCKIHGAAKKGTRRPSDISPAANPDAPPGLPKTEGVTLDGPAQAQGTRLPLKLQPCRQVLDHRGGG